MRIYGNRQFHSEELIAYEAGFRTLVTPSWYIDVATFYNQYDDLYSFQVGAPFLETSPAPCMKCFRRSLATESTATQADSKWRPIGSR